MPMWGMTQNRLETTDVEGSECMLVSYLLNPEVLWVSEHCLGSEYK